MCSLTGVFGLENITCEVLYKGAFSQQHRGEDGVGIAAANGKKIEGGGFYRQFKSEISKLTKDFDAKARFTESCKYRQDIK